MANLKTLENRKGGGKKNQEIDHNPLSPILVASIVVEEGVLLPPHPFILALPTSHMHACSPLPHSTKIETIEMDFPKEEDPPSITFLSLQLILWVRTKGS